jgi:hypothetical protein
LRLLDEPEELFDDELRELDAGLAALRLPEPDELRVTAGRPDEPEDRELEPLD